MRPVLIALLLSAIVPTLGAQQACNPSALQSSAAQAARLRKVLRAQTTGTMETDVPPAMQNQLVQFKNALANVVEAGFACQSPSATPAQIEHALAHSLHANGPEPSQAEELARSNQDEATDEYGTTLKIRATWQSTTPHLLAIEVALGIECGEDTMLFIFEPLEKDWVERLRWQAPKYGKVGDAFGDFFFHTLVQEPGSSTWRLAVAHGRPWCTSRFSGFAIDLLEPTATATSPRVVWHRADGYSRGDAVIRLRSAGNTFELRLNVPALTPEEYERSVIFRYRVDGDRITRVQPSAVNARGFVNEWLSMPWNEAAEQTATSAMMAMHAVYSRIQVPDSKSSYIDYSNGPVRSCLTSKQFQVQIDSIKNVLVTGVPGGRTEPLPSIYFHVLETGNGYQMLSASSKPDSTCSGPDLMPAKR